jgi:predicted lipid-binding transport protein (Tim44 family)
MVRLFSVCALSIVIGVGFGWALRASRPADPDELATASRAQVAQLVLSQQQPAASSGFDLAQLHAAIKEELAAASRSQAGSRQATAAAAKEPVPASAEVIAQRREALQDIQGMIATGEWGNNERAEFQQRIAVLDPEQARQALQQVLIGLNNGTIHALTKAPL